MVTSVAELLELFNKENPTDLVISNTEGMHDFLKIKKKKMYFKRFSAILPADRQNYELTVITASLPIQGEAQTKTLTKNILNYKEAQNLRDPVMNRTKLLDFSMGPCLLVLPCLLKEVQCKCYSIYLGYYQMVDKILKPSADRGEMKKTYDIRACFCCLSLVSHSRSAEKRLK